MRKTVLYLFAAMMTGLMAFTTVEESKNSIEIGASAPMADVKMKDVSGEEYSLNSLKQENGLIVIFSCNTCPFVVGSSNSEGWEGRYNNVQVLADRNKFGMVLVNSNEAKRGNTEGDDTFEKMKTRASDYGYKSKYVLDPNSALADAFGAKTTPHVFMFDKDMKLVYKGAIDDNVKNGGEVKDFYVRDAIVEVSAGLPVKNNSTRPLGCSIKRVKKK